MNGLEPRGTELARLVEGVNARALEMYAANLPRLFPNARSAVLRAGGGVAAFLEKDSLLNYAVGLGLDGKVSGEDIAQICEFYRSRGVMPRVDVCPLADPSLTAALREHNFRLYSFVMVLTRPILPDEDFAPPPDGMVVRVARPEEAELWARVADEGFSDGSPITEERLRFGLLMFSGEAHVPYLVELDGEVAAQGSLFMHGPYAALASCSVRARFRRRGIQNALIRERLRRGRELGGTIAGLFVAGSSQSQRNAERQGFHVAYTKAVMKADLEEK